MAGDNLAAEGEYAEASEVIKTNEDPLRSGVLRELFSDVVACGGDRSTDTVRTIGGATPLGAETDWITTSPPSKVRAEFLELSSVSALTVSELQTTGNKI